MEDVVVGVHLFVDHNHAMIFSLFISWNDGTHGGQGPHAPLNVAT